MTDIITCAEARERGLKKYFTGKPCKSGHSCERYVLNYQCIKCQTAKIRKWRKGLTGEALAKQRKYESEHIRRWMNANPARLEKYRAYQREYQRKKLDLIAVLRIEMPELLKEFGL